MILITQQSRYPIHSSAIAVTTSHHLELLWFLCRQGFNPCLEMIRLQTLSHYSDLCFSASLNQCLRTKPYIYYLFIYLSVYLSFISFLLVFLIIDLCLKHVLYIYLLLFFGEVMGADGRVRHILVSWAWGRQGVDGQSSTKVRQGQYWPCLTPSNGQGGGRRGHGTSAHDDLERFSLCPLSP